MYNANIKSIQLTNEGPLCLCSQTLKWLKAISVVPTPTALGSVLEMGKDANGTQAKGSLPKSTVATQFSIEQIAGTTQSSLRSPSPAQELRDTRMPQSRQGFDPWHEHG